MLTAQTSIDLTREVNEQIVDLFVNYPPQTFEEFREYMFSICELIGIPKPPNKIIDVEYSNSSPLQWMWEVYSEQVSSYIVKATRHGYKTLGSGLLMGMFAAKYGVECDVVGGSYDQSASCYKYVMQLYSIPAFRSLLTGNPLMKSTQLNNGGVIKILASSTKGVRSPHPTKLSIDEIDEMDRKIFEGVKSSVSSRNGVPMTMGMTSTEHNAFGLMYDTIEAAKLDGTKVYQWNILDISEKCTFDCDNCKQKVKFTEDGEKSFYDVCQGKLHEAEGYFKITDIWDKWKNLTFETFEAEWLNRRPSVKHAVYPLIAGPTEHRIIQSFDIKPNWEFYSSWDFGFNFMPVGFYAVDEYENVFLFDEITFKGRVIADVKNEFEAKLKAYKISNTLDDYCDPAGTGHDVATGKTAVGELRAINRNPRYVRSGVMDGVKLINLFMQQNKFKIHPRCVDHIASFRANKYSKDLSEGDDKRLPIKDGSEHWVDEARYFFVNRFRNLNIKGNDK